MSRKTPIDNSERKNKDEIKYKGVRRRRWGKWVSEIRVPGTSTRLWLGSYAAPEAAAVAHDTAVFFLRGPGPLPTSSMNFPWRVGGGTYMWAPLSPGSVQRVASDAGMTADAQLTEELWRRLDKQELPERVFLEEERGRSESSDQGFGLHEELKIYDMEIYM